MVAQNGAREIGARGGPELTVVILTLNEEKHIAECIASVTWADRVIVLDAFSHDQTVQLAGEMGAEILQSEFRNFAHQRNTALEKIATDWVFFVDADERGTDRLGTEIRAVISTRPESGWYVPRHNYIFGQLTRGAGWYPDYQLRLFRHGAVCYERPVHEVAVVDGDIGYLENVLLHHNYEDISQFHRKQQRYTDYDAQILLREGVSVKSYTPFTQMIRHFWWRFVSLRGYRDGLHGLKLSTYMAYYEWLKYRKLAGLSGSEIGRE